MGRDEIYLLRFRYGYVDKSVMIATHLRLFEKNKEYVTNSIFGCAVGYRSSASRALKRGK
ncbi:hypothetical protein TSUD_61400 [Trifolium subterraneum]|uniref:Uncharacterized protein n=1 Tax=Trifolium subterraneum TaxID=3900 RepID=A0A2Z6MZZ8_TRISU|nr:hypothetical protein TSUD_61400 [Trifolium subterraneum]